MKVAEILQLSKRPEFYDNYYSLDSTKLLYLTSLDIEFYKTLFDFTNNLIDVNRKLIFNNKIDLDTGSNIIFHKNSTNTFNKNIVEYIQNSLKKHKIIKKVRSTTKANVMIVPNGTSYQFNSAGYSKFYLLSINAKELIEALNRNNKSIHLSLLNTGSSIDLKTYLHKYQYIEVLFSYETFDEEEFTNNKILKLNEINEKNSEFIDLVHDLCLFDNVEINSQVIYVDLPEQFINFDYDHYNDVYDVICNFYKLNGSKSDFIKWVDNNYNTIIQNFSVPDEPIYLPFVSLSSLERLMYNSKFESDSLLMSIDSVYNIISSSEHDPLSKYKILAFKDSCYNVLYYYAFKIITGLTIQNYTADLRTEIINYYPFLRKILDIDNSSSQTIQIEDLNLHLLSTNSIKSSSYSDFNGKLKDFINSSVEFILYLIKEYSLSKEIISKHIQLVETIVNEIYLIRFCVHDNVTKQLFLSKTPILINYNLEGEKKAKLYGYNNSTEMKIIEKNLIPQDHYYGAVIKRTDR